MANTFNKELAKKVRNVQEDIKTDFCKHCKEKACDGCFVGDMTEAYTLRAEIALDQEELDYINGMMSMTGYEIYKKYGFDKGEIVAKTVIFADSFKATIKLISYSTSEPPYLASLLFDKDGTLVVLSAPEDVNDGARFDGDWEFESAGIRYIVTVKAKEPCISEIVLDQEELDFINQLLSMTGDEIYDKYGLKRDETIVNTAVFPDGMQADIKLVICDGENKPYTEAVLFDKNGFQKAYTDPEDEYTGDWELEYDDVNYVVAVKVKEPVGYRSDDIFGDGYRDAVDVIAHEVFELRNSDILDTLADGVLKDMDIAENLKHLSYDISSPKAVYFADILEEENESVAEDKAKAFAREILDAVRKKTSKDIQYVLWLSDSVDDVIAEYEPNDSITEFDEYSTADSVVLSDIGKGGKLFGYEKLPAVIRTVNRQMETIE